MGSRCHPRCRGRRELQGELQPLQGGGLENIAPYSPPSLPSSAGDGSQRATEPLFCVTRTGEPLGAGWRQMRVGLEGQVETF